MADTGIQWLITDVPEAINKAGDFEPWAKVYTNWEMLDFGRRCCAAALASRPAEVDDKLIMERVADIMAKHGIKYQPGIGSMIVDVMGLAYSATTIKEK